MIQTEIYLYRADVRLNNQHLEENEIRKSERKGHPALHMWLVPTYYIEAKHRLN